MKIKFLFVGLLFLISHSYGQQDNPKFDTAKCKMKLTQFLLSTHSLTMTAIAEEDVKTKLLLRVKAVKYLEYASNQYADLKKNTKIDPELNKDLMKLFDTYSGILEDSQKLYKPEMAFALQILESVYKLKVLPKLWCNK